MENVLGSSMSVFLGVTVVLFGGAGWMTGRALAITWKSFWFAVPYSLLLGAGARFLTFALFEGTFLSSSGYLISVVVVWLVMLIAFRLYRTHQVVQQYPWMVERRGPFAWRQKDSGTP
ncbi:hypothetical protein NKDENANG_03356 [Candidatus Entotheonellaceae bacterium PAL068K]